MFALIDCNNFYASCEQLFNPRIYGKPVVILSNNDGCVIARSKEARALGVPMGAPAFQWKDHFSRHQIVTLSSNFTLYGDMSIRVFDVLMSFGFPLEIYSIDEAFALLEGPFDPQIIRDKVYQWTGIPTSVGVAPTKTLAKVATHLAKRAGKNVWLLDENPAPYLKELPVSEVWGIGHRYTKKLSSLRIHTAHQFASQPDTWIKKHFTILGLQTALELRGIPCFSLEDVPSKRKSIVSSRSFKQPVTDRTELERLLSAMVARAAEKLRSEGVFASHLALFLATNRFSGEPYQSDALSATLSHPTHDTPYLISQMKKLLDRMYQPHLLYKRGGVYLADFSEGVCPQLDMLSQDPNRTLLMQVMDHINMKYGPSTLHSAALHPVPKRKETVSFHTPQYTTCWDDIVKISL